MHLWHRSAPIVAALLVASPLAAARAAADAGSDDWRTEKSADAGAAPGLEANVEGGKPEVAVVAPVKRVDLERAEKESADMADVLARTEGVSVQRIGSLGTNVRIGLDGLNGNAIRLLVDDVPLGMAGFRAGLTSIPLGYVDHIDIYSGVVPIELGADALGGVVNVVLRRPQPGLGIDFSEEFGSFLTDRVSLGAHYGAAHGFYIRFNAFGDYSKNDYEIDATIPVNFHPVAGVFPLFHNRYRDYDGRVEAGVQGVPWADLFYVRVFGGANDQQVNTNLYMKLAYGDVLSNSQGEGAVAHYQVSLLGGAAHVNATAGYGHQELNYVDDGECVYDWADVCLNPRNPPYGEADSSPHNRTQWENSIYARAFADWSPSEDDKLVLSFAPTFTNRTGIERELDLMPTTDSLRGRHRIYEQVSGLSYQRDFFAHRLRNLLFGKDYDYVVSTTNSDFTSTSRSHLHYEGGGDMLLFAPIEPLTFKASYEYAIRMPTAEELLGDNVFIGSNSALKPERSHNGNLSAELRAPTPVGQTHLELDGFLRDEHDLIFLFSPMEGTAQYANVGDARVLGTGGALGWKSPGRWVEADVNGSYVNAINTATDGLFADYNGEPIPNQPRIFGNASLRFNWRHLFVSSSVLSLVWYGHYVDGYATGWQSLGSTATQQRVPTQFSQALALSWTARAGKDWKYSASVEMDDIADAKLYDYFGAQRPGRAVYAKLTFEYGTSPRNDSP